MRIMLKAGSLDIQTTEEEKFGFVINAAQGLLNFGEIKVWINSRLV